MSSGSISLSEIATLRSMTEAQYQTLLCGLDIDPGDSVPMDSLRTALCADPISDTMFASYDGDNLSEFSDGSEIPELDEVPIWQLDKWLTALVRRGEWIGPPHSLLEIIEKDYTLEVTFEGYSATYIEAVDIGEKNFSALFNYLSTPIEVEELPLPTLMEEEELPLDDGSSEGLEDLVKGPPLLGIKPTQNKRGLRPTSTPVLQKEELDSQGFPLSFSRKPFRERCAFLREVALMEPHLRGPYFLSKAEDRVVLRYLNTSIHELPLAQVPYAFTGKRKKRKITFNKSCHYYGCSHSSGHACRSSDFRRRLNAGS